MQIQHPYLIVAVYCALAGALVAALIIVASLLGPRRPTSGKAEAYECGMRPVGDARLRFPVKFYVVGIMFLLFSLEVIFLVPWAIVYRDLVALAPAFAFVEMGVFLLILVVGYVYVWKRGALDWGEADRSIGGSHEDELTHTGR